MKRSFIAVAVIAGIGLLGTQSSADGPKTCAKKCADKYDQCVKDAIEYGHSPADARSGCGELRAKCLKDCE